MTLAIAFGVVGVGAGTAQAWPWDVGNDIGAYIAHFCQPFDVPSPNTHRGTDTVLGLNMVEDSDKRETIIPEVYGELAGTGGQGSDRLDRAYDSHPDIVTPTYERYGFNTLQWSNFGADCASIGFWFNSVNNVALTMFVKMPMTVAFATLQWSMDNNLYDIVAGMITPVVQVFTAIAMPWGIVIAPIGVALVWLKTQSTVAVFKAALWVMLMYGVVLWMHNHTSDAVKFGNNIVTSMTGEAACQIAEAQSGQDCDSDNPLGNVHQSLWHGVTYQTWLLGQVGEEQAASSRVNERNGRVGWGAALLNGNYVGDDDTGSELQASIGLWNQRSNAPNGDDTKTDAWADEAMWQQIPYLANVKFMCNDVGIGAREQFEEGADYQRWLYGGNCDHAGAETSSMVPYFTGDAYSERMIAAISGGVASLAVVVAVVAAGAYLLVQKILFYLLLLFAPIFLTIAMFADDKRRPIATRYGTIVAGNVLKQVIAVLVVLFVSYSMSTLLYPPPHLNLPTIPWLVKPLVAWLFFFALLVFAKPMANVMKAAKDGDTSVVDRAATAPKRAAKGAAKAAGTTAATLATGGAAGGVMAAGKGAKFATVATALGRGNTATSGIARSAARLNLARDAISNARATRDGRSQAMDSAVSALASGPGGQHIERDANGELTKKGRKQAEQTVKGFAADGQRHEKSSSVADAYMADFFAGYRRKTGGVHHPNDPSSPQNKAQAASANASGDTAGKVGDVKYAAATPNGDGSSAGKGQSSGKYVNDQFAAQANAASTAPRYATNGRGAGVGAQTRTAGSEVLRAEGVSPAQAAADPSRLLIGDAYNGGDTTVMDPQHPATAALTKLRFAATHGTEDELHEATEMAGRKLAKHGAPDQVTKAHSTSAAAESFEVAQVVGAMPNIRPQSTWNDMADGAVTMQSAVASMPDQHPARDKVDTFVRALGTPGTDPNALMVLRDDAVQRLQETADWAPPAAEPDASPFTRASAPRSGASSTNDHGPTYKQTSAGASPSWWGGSEPPPEGFEPPPDDHYDGHTQHSSRWSRSAHQASDGAGYSPGSEPLAGERFTVDADGLVDDDQDSGNAGDQDGQGGSAVQRGDSEAPQSGRGSRRRRLGLRRTGFFGKGNGKEQG